MRKFAKQFSPKDPSERCSRSTTTTERHRLMTRTKVLHVLLPPPREDGVLRREFESPARPGMISDNALIWSVRTDTFSYKLKLTFRERSAR